MEPVKAFIPKLTTLLLLLLSGVRLMAQPDSTRLPKNYLGAFAGIQWNILSALAGVEYEGIVLAKNNLAIGVKGLYIFPHQFENVQLLNRSYGETSSLVMVMVSGHYFTSSQKHFEGLFLTSAIGPGVEVHKIEASSYKETSTILGFEVGLGWQWQLKGGVAIRWTNAVFFARYGGITQTKLSVGF